MLYFIAKSGPIFQGVHEASNFGPAQGPWKEGEERVNKGENL